MDIIFGDRNSGKTTKLIDKWLKDKNGFLVVRDYNEIKRIRFYLKCNAITDYNAIITYGELLREDMILGYNEIYKPVLYIDNFVDYMRSFMKTQFFDMGAISINGTRNK